MNVSSKLKVLLPATMIVLFISSCIPSLHPIYSDSTIAVDDRLLGTWSIESSSEVASLLGDVPLNYDLEITSDGDSLFILSDPGANTKVTKKMITEAFDLQQGSIFPSSKSRWTFERAAEVEFEKKWGENSSSNITMSVGTRSFAPEGYEVITTNELPFYILTHQEVEEGETVISYLLVHMTEIGGEMYLDFVPFPKGDKRRQGEFSANYISGHTFAKVEFENGKLLIKMFDGTFVEELLQSRRVRLRHEKLGVDGNIVLTASTKELRAFISKYGDNSELFDEAQIFTQL